jgi:hypothetical protein
MIPREGIPCILRDRARDTSRRRATAPTPVWPHTEDRSIVGQGFGNGEIAAKTWLVFPIISDQQDGQAHHSRDQPPHRGPGVVGTHVRGDDPSDPVQRHVDHEHHEERVANRHVTAP